MEKDKSISLFIIIVLALALGLLLGYVLFNNKSVPSNDENKDAESTEARMSQEEMDKIGEELNKWFISKEANYVSPFGRSKIEVGKKDSEDAIFLLVAREYIKKNGYIKGDNLPRVGGFDARGYIEKSSLNSFAKEFLNLDYDYDYNADNQYMNSLDLEIDVDVASISPYKDKYYVGLVPKGYDGAFIVNSIHQKTTIDDNYAYVYSKGYSCTNDLGVLSCGTPDWSYSADDIINCYPDFYYYESDNTLPANEPYCSELNGDEFKAFDYVENNLLDKVQLYKSVFEKGQDGKYYFRSTEPVSNMD